MRIAKGQMRIVECEMRIAKCEMLIAEWGINAWWEMGLVGSNYQYHVIINGEGEMRSTKC